MNRREVLKSSSAAGVLALVGGGSAGASGDDVLLGFVGDLLIDRDRPDEVYAPVRDLLAAPDVLFGNMEGPMPTIPAPCPAPGRPWCLPRTISTRSAGPGSTCCRWPTTTFSTAGAR